MSRPVQWVTCGSGRRLIYRERTQGQAFATYGVLLDPAMDGPAVWVGRDRPFGFSCWADAEAAARKL